MDYETKYKEALGKAKKVKHYIETIGCSMDKDMLEIIFPELAESEDERIRIDIISYINGTRFSPVETEERLEWLTWLEKQGEQKSTYHKFRVGDRITSSKNGEIKYIIEEVGVKKTESLAILFLGMK